AERVAGAHQYRSHGEAKDEGAHDRHKPRARGDQLRVAELALTEAADEEISLAREDHAEERQEESDERHEIGGAIEKGPAFLRAGFFAAFGHEGNDERTERAFAEHAAREVGDLEGEQE